MKTIIILAACAAGFTMPTTAFAQSTPTSQEEGRWEWKSPPSYGARAPLRAPTRVWVPAATATADKTEKATGCDCEKMPKGDDCMKMDKSAS